MQNSKTPEATTTHIPTRSSPRKCEETYTILVPNMLPVQLGLICRLMKNYGYDMELLHTEGPNIAEQGLRNVHNDTCYPALLVIGQLMDAIEVRQVRHPQNRRSSCRRPAAAAARPTISTCCARRWKRAATASSRSFR